MMEDIYAVTHSQSVTRTAFSPGQVDKPGCWPRVQWLLEEPENEAKHKTFPDIATQSSAAMEQSPRFLVPFLEIRAVEIPPVKERD